MVEVPCLPAGLAAFQRPPAPGPCFQGCMRAKSVLQTTCALSDADSTQGKLLLPVEKVHGVTAEITLLGIVHQACTRFRMHMHAALVISGPHSSTEGVHSRTGMYTAMLICCRLSCPISAHGLLLVQKKCSKERGDSLRSAQQHTCAESCGEVHNVVAGNALRAEVTGGHCRRSGPAQVDHVHSGCRGQSEGLHLSSKPLRL